MSMELKNTTLNAGYVLKGRELVPNPNDLS